MINDSTVMNKLPSSDTSQSGILAKKPVLSMAVMISFGSAAVVPAMPPTLLAAVATMPLQTLKMFVIKSMP